MFIIFCAKLFGGDNAPPRPHFHPKTFLHKSFNVHLKKRKRNKHPLGTKIKIQTFLTTPVTDFIFSSFFLFVIFSEHNVLVTGHKENTANKKGKNTESQIER